MQKLLAKLKNVPTGAPQACSSTSSVLNRDQNLSAQDIVLTNNNLEVDLPASNSSQGLRVPVINMRGKPLMPCRRGVARKLLEQKKAVVINLFPFVIKLKQATGETVDRLVLGVDIGYRWNGFSIVGKKRELFSGTLELDGKTSERLATKAMYRRGRRNKLWYREPRWNNRTRVEGWLPPSVQKRYDSILRYIKKMCSWYPIAEIILETASFDIQKINNPEIQGVEYQQGDLYGYQNMRAYLFTRENGLCQYCGKEFNLKDSSHIHHIIPRPAGTDKPDNLALLHDKCHKKLHKKKKPTGLKPGKQFKAETWMSIVRNRFVKDLPESEITFGYITNLVRNSLGLPKTHFNDAFVIAGGTDQERVESVEIKQKRKNNRCLQLNRKGYKPSIRKQRYSLQPGDLIKIKGSNKIYVVKGVHGYGKMVRVKNGDKFLDFKAKLVSWCYHQKTIMY